MNSKLPSHGRRVINSLYGKLGRSRDSVPSRHLPHWAYAICAIGIFVMLLVVVLQAGYTELRNRTPLPTPSLPIAGYYPTPTPFPTWDDPTAFVSTGVLRVFDDSGASGNYVTQLRAGDRVQILAQGADGVWTQIRTWDGNVGWTRTDSLVMASASLTPVPTVQAQAPPDILFKDNFQDPESGLGSQVGETGESYYQDGEYVIRVTESGGMWWSLYNQVFMDCEIEVEAHPTAGECMRYSLVFRSWHDGRYSFTIYPGGAYDLQKEIDYQAPWVADRYRSPWVTEPWIESDAILQGHQMNRLRVGIDGPQISLYVNDQLLQTVTDTTFEGGQIGFMVESYSYCHSQEVHDQLAEVHFDNLEVRSLTQTTTPTPTPASTSPLDSTHAFGDRCQFIHVAEIPDTIFSITKKYGVSLEDIVVANGARSWRDLVGPGKVLCIPFATSFTKDLTVDPTPAPGSGCRFMHAIRKPYDYYNRDDLYYITMRYGVSKEAIISANGLERDYLTDSDIGRTLCIP